jgi:hypothetical protein
MRSLSDEHLTKLGELLRGSALVGLALSESAGMTQVANGLWRIYAPDWPDGGAANWNSEHAWKKLWAPYLPSGIYFFGEDVFGNQLALIGTSTNVMMWNHESAEMHDLYVGPLELLKTVLENGVDWIDFYGNGSPGIARQHGAVAPDIHLHWTTPLILGGRVEFSNTCLVPRAPHLVGHAKLWSQVGRLSDGTAVITK